MITPFRSVFEIHSVTLTVLEIGSAARLKFINSARNVIHTVPNGDIAVND